MSRMNQNQYAPDYVSAPGETLLETLESLGMTQADLAERTGRPRKVINEIIKGKAPITPETALQLERVLGVPAHFWNNRERRYRESLARNDERTRLASHIGWLSNFPVKAMTKLGWIREREDKVDQVDEMLRFFGVVSPADHQAVWQGINIVFRQSTAFTADQYAVTAWLRQGEIEAQQIECAPYEDPNHFREVLQNVRRLTVQPPEKFVPEVIQFCALAGVAVVFIPELPKIRASGATRWLTPTKALLQLSLRYKTDDHLWFTFFHEAAHILLHGKRDIFIHDGTSNDKVDKEEEANHFAANTLIPQTAFHRFSEMGRYDQEAIEQFAKEQGISPGIVVGRLQHEGCIPFNRHNALKQRLAWATDDPSAEAENQLDEER